jgi:gluconate:H+ symporter, GntP family
MPPLPILLLGFAVVLGAIIVLRLHAFLALVAAAILVALLAPGEPAAKVAVVADGFGRTAGQLGVIVALAAIIGGAMSGSGASDRIVRGFVNLLGERRGAQALGATAFVLSLPVFFDTIFFLLAPLARSMYRTTGRDYLKYLLAVSAGAVATHVLVPPHPGPLAMASALGVDLGTMVLMGIVVALPSAAVGLVYAGWASRHSAHALQPPAAAGPEVPVPAALPGLVPSLLPVLLPVFLISLNTVVSTLRTAMPGRGATWSAITPVTAAIGNPNVALLLATIVALTLYARAQHPTRAELGRLVESSLLGAGAIVLIVGAGGAFGAALQMAGVGTLVNGFAGGGAQGAGLALLLLVFAVAAVLRIAQGSSTVAMVTTAGMIAAMIQGVALPFHPVYVATAIAGGSLVGSWMNDAGFWVFSRVGGVSEAETLRTWTPLLTVVGTTALVTTLLLALLLPLR